MSVSNRFELRLNTVSLVINYLWISIYFYWRSWEELTVSTERMFPIPNYCNLRFEHYWITVGAEQKENGRGSRRESYGNIILGRRNLWNAIMWSSLVHTVITVIAFPIDSISRTFYLNIIARTMRIPSRTPPTPHSFHPLIWIIICGFYSSLLFLYKF